MINEHDDVVGPPPAGEPDAVEPAGSSAPLPEPEPTEPPALDEPTPEPVPATPPAVETEPTGLPSMDELMAQYDAAEPLQELREGEVVMGTVVQIDDHGAMIDVGTKSEGIITKPELDLIRDELRVGQQIEVCVLRIEDEDGHLRVSKRSADRERAWGDIVDKQDSGEVLEAPVVEAVKGGLLVDLGLYGQGFVPASHVSLGRPRNLNRYVGQTLRLQVIEVERKRKRVVLSHRKVLEDARASERDDTVASLREGQVRRGVVRRITDFGAFVDLGGLDGLLHVSELSWTRVGSPHDELRVNDSVEVMVLKLNLEEGRISLGRRQLLHDPWRDVPKLYSDGQAVRATVVDVRDDRALVRLPIGVEGVITIPEELRGAANGREAPAPASEPEASDEVEATEAEAAEPASEAVEAVEAIEAVEPVEAVEPTEATEPAVEPVEPVEPEAVGPKPLAPGDEVEVRVDAIRMNEREIDLALASTPRARAAEPAVEPGVPVARGRYSDRREEDDSRTGRRERRTGRRERDRERERERDREEARPPAETTAPPAQRTLGDLMGDKLRSLMEQATGESDREEDNPVAAEDPPEE